ncbi:hypothetical protein C0993_006872 [Termitomyces sp. T159_Od127]|nr:hypothetical protein C0993_006872 [Termitomyces sp. T159_Od127]
MSQDLPEDFERAELLVIKLDQRSPSLQVVLVKPDKGARGPVRGDFAVRIGMLSVCLVSNVDFFLEELMKGLEVLGNFVSYMGWNVSKGKGEPGVVTFISIKRRHASGRVRGVVVGELSHRQFGVPVVLQTVNIEIEVLLQGLIHLLSLVISLWVISKLRHKEEAVVGDDVIWESVPEEYMFKEQFGKLWDIVDSAAGDEDCLFGEVADNDKDGIEALQLGELNNVVH